MKTIKVRNFEKRDQDHAYEIWKNGMTEDLGELFNEYYMATSRVKIILIVTFIIPFFTASSYWKCLGIIVDLAIVGIIHFYGKLLSIREINKKYLWRSTKVYQVHNSVSDYASVNS